MDQAKILLKEFIDCYKDSLGIEGAENVLKQAVQKAGLKYQTDFTKEDAIKICRELKQQSGFVGIIGGIMISRIAIR